MAGKTTAGEKKEQRMKESLTGQYFPVFQLVENESHAIWKGGKSLESEILAIIDHAVLNIKAAGQLLYIHIILKIRPRSQHYYVYLTDDESETQRI